MRRIKDIEQVKEILRNEIALEEVAEHLGVSLKPAGPDQLKAVCPFHEETHPSFAISRSKQLFFCHGCKEGGDLYGFVQKYENLTFIEALLRVGEIANFDFTPFQKELTEEEKREARLYEINDYILREHALGGSAPEAIAYISARRLPEHVVESFRLGYSSRPPKRPKQYTSEEWKALGLDRKDQWTDSYVIPLIDPYGRVAGFRNRPRVVGEGPRMLGPHDGHPIAVPQIYGLHEARSYVRRAGHLILVEGEADVWAMQANGYHNTAATLGTKLNDEQLSYLNDMGIGRVILMADGDAGGRKFSLRVARRNSPSKVTIKIAHLADGDPDEILLRDGTDAIDQAITGARYAFEYLIDQVISSHEYLNPSTKLDILAELKESLSGRPEYEHDLAMSMLSERLDMSKDALSDYFRDTPAEDTPLYNLRAERLVLARMLNDEMFIGEAISSLKRQDFYLNRHRTVFESIVFLYQTEDTINEDIINTYLQNRGEREAAQFVESLAKDKDDVRSAEFLLADLRDKSIRRETKKKAEELVGRVTNTALDASSIIQTATSDLAKIISNVGEKVFTTDILVRDRMALLHERLRNPNLIIGLDLGDEWKIVNATLHGIQENRYIIIAAPSGVGKTLMANAWQRRISVGLNEPSALLTFETTPETIIDRMIAQMSGVESDKIVTGFMSKEEVELVQDAAAAIRMAPMVITTRGRYVEEAIAFMKYDFLKRGTKIFFLDYFQLMYMQGRKSNMNRTQELGEISGMLFEFAMEYPVTVVNLAQINREGAKKGTNINKEDSGDSYKLAQDSDIYIILREKTKEELETDGPEHGDRYLWIDKHRQGRSRVGTNVRADLPTNRIEEI